MSAPLHKQKRAVNQSLNALYFHLKSIQEDAELVRSLVQFLPNDFPAFGNLRNGAWYGRFDHFCYFKSTDGHDRNLSFNCTTRLNLNVAEKAALFGGALIVDSTRRGKVFPDAMRATIPLWCAIVNCILELDSPQSFTAPRWLISPSLFTRIVEDIIPRTLSTIPASLRQLIVDRLKGVLTKPLKPVWLYPDEEDVIEWNGDFAQEALECLSRGTESASDLSFSPILLLSCSKARRVSEQSWEYIQGAADDEEAWSLGLRHDVFWDNMDKILSTEDPAVVDNIVRQIVADKTNINTRVLSTSIAFERVRITIAPCTDVRPDVEFDGVLSLSTTTTSSISNAEIYVINYKSADFFKRVVDFYQTLRNNRGGSNSTVAVPPSLLIFYDDSSGRDAALQTVLVIILVFFREIMCPESESLVCKESIRTLDLDPQPAIISKGLVRSAVATMQTWLPAEIAWNPAKREIKCILRFLEDWGGGEEAKVLGNEKRTK